MKNIVTDYGAVPGQDCTAAFQAAAKIGGKLYVPVGDYYATGTADSAIVAPGWFRMIGEGTEVSRIFCQTTTGVHGLTFRPAPGQSMWGAGVESMSILPAPGFDMGAAIRVDLTATGAWMEGANFSDLHLQMGSTSCSAFQMDNPNNLNGFDCSTIRNSYILGGINLVRAGDSLNIIGNKLCGPNVGFQASFVAGAARLTFERNNITSTAGAIFLINADQAYIFANQMEQDEAHTGTLNGMVMLSGCLNCGIRANNINNHGNVYACVVIEGGTANTMIAENTMTTGGSCVHVAMGPGCPGGAALGQSNPFYGGPQGAGFPVTALDASSSLLQIPC